MTGCAGGLSGGLWAPLRRRRSSPGRRSCSTRWTSTRGCARPARVVTGEGRIDEQTLQGKIVGEIAVRARQGGVACSAIVGRDELDAFGARMLDLQRVLEATTLAEIEAAATSLAEIL